MLAEKRLDLSAQITTLRTQLAQVNDRLDWTVEDNAKKAVRIADLQAEVERHKEYIIRLLDQRVNLQAEVERLEGAAERRHDCTAHGTCCIDCNDRLSAALAQPEPEEKTDG